MDNFAGGERFPCREPAGNMVAVAVAVASAVAAAATATAVVASWNSIMHSEALKRYSHACFETQDQITLENMQPLETNALLSAIKYMAPLFI